MTSSSTTLRCGNPLPAHQASNTTAYRSLRHTNLSAHRAAPPSATTHDGQDKVNPGNANPGIPHPQKTPKR
eukprot:1355766-Amphidinium_carterae.2